MSCHTWGLAAVLAVALSAPGYAGAAEVVHVVVKGQTLGGIARRYHTSVDALRGANGLRPGQFIKPGLTLVIPENDKDASATKKTAKPTAGKAEAPRKGGEAKRESKKPEPKKNGGKAKPVTYAQKPKRPGFVRLVRGSEKLETQLLTRHGRLSPSALPALSRILRHFPSGSKTPIDPRLATLVGMVSDHFGGRTIHVVSGYRPVTPTQYTKHSNHNIGRAMDFMIEGVPNTVVRDFCRTFRNAGVGYYPNSTFVHLDVRTAKVYWIDYSKPGEAPRYDSPVAQESADEATRDVDSAPNAGQAGGAEPQKDAQPTPPTQGGEVKADPSPPL